MKEYCCFTACNVAYLHKALALAESLHLQDKSELRIYLFDKKRDLPEFPEYVNICWIEDINIENLNILAFKYDVTEFCTSLKPYIALILLEEYEKVLFFDPDIYIFNKIDTIVKTLDNEDIVLTPHYTTPQERGTSLSQSDVGMMRFGSFNLGFFAVKKSKEGLKFLHWWDDRCQDLCYFETQFGLSTDQKWVSIAPCFFPNLHVSFDLGLNVAFWNLHERQITSEKNQKFLVNEKFDLIFFHFSSYDSSNALGLTTRPLAVDIEGDKLLHRIMEVYNEVHNKYLNLLSNADKKYSFDYMNNGLYISPTLRRAYASLIPEFSNGHNPFDFYGEVGVFSKKNNLISKKNKLYKPEGFDNIGKYERRFKYINIFMKIVLYVLGPLKFYNLSRLFVYLSSYRQINGLWRK